jgi:hypothetical protein
MVSIRPTCCATLLLLVVLHDDYVISCSLTFMISRQTTVSGKTRVGFDPGVRRRMPHPLRYREHPGLLQTVLESPNADSGLTSFSWAFIMNFLHQRKVSAYLLSHFISPCLVTLTWPKRQFITVKLSSKMKACRYTDITKPVNLDIVPSARGSDRRFSCTPKDGALQRSSLLLCS